MTAYVKHSAQLRVTLSESYPLADFNPVSSFLQFKNVR